MSQQPPTAEAMRATRRAVARIRSYGLDGPRPIDEIAALDDLGDDVDAALRKVLEDAGPDDLPAALHLVTLMRREQLLETVRELAFEGPADLTAKREAVAALRKCDVEPEAEIVARLAALEALAVEPSNNALAELMEWPASWREPALDQWLAAAGDDRLSSVEIALGIQPELDARMLDWMASLGSRDAADALMRFLSQARDKDRVKQVKKALHRLRSQGVEVEDSSTETEGGFTLAIETGALQDSRTYLTSIDGRGARLVWVLWRAPSGGSRLLQAVVDDEVGVREAEAATVTRQGFRDYVEEMKKNPTVLLQQVPYERASEVLAAAAMLTESAEGALPADYRSWAELAEVPPRPAGSSPIYDHIEEFSLRGDETLIDDAMTQLREPHFQSWALYGDVVGEAAEEVRLAESSTLMISDEQRKERMQDAIRGAIVGTFDGEARKRYRGRLEAMAEMLWDRSQRDEARQVLAAAVGMTEVEDLFRGHSFARAMAHRGVWLAYQDKQREIQSEEQRSRIVRP